MIKLLTLSLLCLFLIPVILVALLLFSIPFAIVMAVLPWLLRFAAIILRCPSCCGRPGGDASGLLRKKQRKK